MYFYLLQYTGLYVHKYVYLYVQMYILNMYNIYVLIVKDVIWWRNPSRCWHWFAYADSVWHALWVTLAGSLKITVIRAYSIK